MASSRGAAVSSPAFAARGGSEGGQELVDAGLRGGVPFGGLACPGLGTLSRTEGRGQLRPHLLGLPPVGLAPGGESLGAAHRRVPLTGGRLDLGRKLVRAVTLLGDLGGGSGGGQVGPAARLGELGPQPGLGGPCGVELLAQLPCLGLRLRGGPVGGLPPAGLLGGDRLGLATVALGIHLPARLPAGPTRVVAVLAWSTPP